MPSQPHVEVSATGQVVRSRGFVPAEMNVQTPIDPGAPHVLHDSVQATLQQRPSTQYSLEQSAPPEHAWPLAFFVSVSLLQAASPLAWS